MSAQDKVIKISFAVDPSLATAKRAIEEITLSVKNLVDQSQAAAKLLGGIGGGASALPPRPGTNPANQIKHNAAGQAGGGMMKGLAAAATGTAAVYKGAATAAGLAFKEMTEGFTKMVDAHEAQVVRLQKIMTNYNTAIGKATPGGGAGGGGGGGGAAAAAAANGGAAAAQAVRVGPGAGGGGGGRGGGGGGAGGGAAGGGLFGAGGQGAMFGGQGGIFAGLAQRMGLPTGVVGGAAALTTGINVANAFTGSAYENQLSNINMMVDRPTFMSQGRADMGRIFGGNALAIRHGDIYRGYAQAQLAKEASTKEMLGQDILLEGRRQMENPTTVGGHMAKSGAVTGGKAIGGAALGSALMGAEQGAPGTVAAMRAGASVLNQYRASNQDDGFFARIKRGAARIGSGVLGASATANEWLNNAGSMSGTKIDAKIETERADVIALKRSQANQMALQAQRQQEQLERKMMEDPMMQARMNSQYSNALSDASMMRSFGMSGHQVLNKKTGERFDAGDYMRAKALGQNRDVGELSGAAQEMASVAGRGFLGKYGASLDAKTGGLHNAAQILGVGAQFGGGSYAAGKSFLGGIQGKIGRGGVDVTAGSQIAGFGASSMMASNFVGTSGSGLMSTLLDAAYTGTTGGDMRKARELAGGMEFREQRAAGGIDQLNKALNLSAAMKAAPEAPWTVRNTLASMQDASILDIIKTGKVPSILSDNGVTADMVEKYYSATNMTKFARFGSAAEYGTEEQREAVSRYREAGGVGYMKGMSKRERERETNLLAGAYSTGTGTTLTKARADLEIEESAAGLLGGFTGHGAHDSFSKTSTAAKAGEAQKILMMTDAKAKAEASELFEKQFHMTPERVAANEKARVDGQKNMVPGGDVGSAIGGVSTALNALVDALKAEFGGSGGGKGKGAPAAAGPH